ncbi:MAG: AzlC family ABC transporter permease [Acidobacteriota bacterium]|nr:AzlC family ABC transporter permease [Acidobacteriota bacterium]
MSAVAQNSWQGVKAVSPLLPGIFPFGVIAGASAVELGLPTMQALGLSLFVFAGASQLVLVEMWDRQAPALILLATVLVVNLRFTMYSAALAPHFRGMSSRWKSVLAYLLTDQAYLLSIGRYEDKVQGTKWFYMGVALTLWIVWQAGTATGVFLGNTLPDSWSLDFAVPLSFLALLIPSLNSRGALIAAVTAGTLVLLTRLMPFNLGLIAATLAGVAAGMLTERRS